MNFGHHYFIRKALLCLLGWGIFLVPMSVMGSAETLDPHATKLTPSLDTETGNKGSDSAEISFKTSDEFCSRIKSDLDTYKMLSGQLDEAEKELEHPSKRDKKEVQEEIEAIKTNSEELRTKLSAYFEKLKNLRPQIANEDLANYDETLAKLEKYKLEHETKRKDAEKKFWSRIKSDLDTYKMLSGQLDEAKKELEHPSKRDKKEVQEEIEAIKTNSEELLTKLSAYFDKLKNLRPQIANEDLANYDAILAKLEKSKLEHETKRKAAEKEEAIKRQLEIESETTKTSTEKAEDLKEQIKKAKDEIQKHITTENPSSQLKAELEDTIKRLEKHEEDLGRMIETKNSIAENDPYVPYQSQAAKPSTPEETPESTGGAKNADNNKPQNSGSNSENSSSRSGLSSSTSGSSSPSTLSRGSAAELGKHSTVQIGGTMPELPNSVAKTVAGNQQTTDFAKGFGAKAGVNSPPTTGINVSPNSNPTGAGSVTTPTSNLTAPTTGQPTPITRSPTAAGTPIYNFNSGETKQDTSPSEATPNPTVGQQSMGPDPLGTRPWAGEQSVAIVGKPSTESRRVNVAYNTSSTGPTNYGPTNISIQQTYETPTGNNGSQAEPKKLAFDKNGELMESTAGPKREVSSIGNYETNSTPVDTNMELKKLSSEIVADTPDLKVTSNSNGTSVKNETPVNPTLSTIDQFIAGIQEESQNGKSLLGEIFSLGKDKKRDIPKNRISPETKTLLAGTQASSAEPPSLVNIVKNFLTALLN